MPLAAGLSATKEFVRHFILVTFSQKLFISVTAVFLQWLAKDTFMLEIDCVCDDVPPLQPKANPQTQ
jgi:hypothetical protein